MLNNSMKLAEAMFGGRQDMASQSYNTAGTMRPNMGAIINGQPSLPTPMVSMNFLNVDRKNVNSHVRPKGEPNRGIAGMSDTWANIGHASDNNPGQHLNDMGNNPAHPAAQLASYLFANRLTDPTMFYKGG